MTYKNSTANSPTHVPSANFVARIGFVLSLIGFLGVFMAGPLAQIGSDVGGTSLFCAYPVS